MSLYKNFRTDPEVEKNGVVLDYGPNKDLPLLDGKHPNIEIRVARAGGANEAYNKRMEFRLKPHRRHIQHDTIESETLTKLVKEVFAETVVLGWKNVTDSQGKTMEFSKANCLKLFEELPDVFLDIQEQSQRAALFRSAVREDDAGN